ncbi:pentapeptide repeat-containing protein [Flexibacterium corallicola]|uniref:pentapeptide repeat-containing protein n=1 Tax=Flexibacterium corallicola TaxID=3037259 RepID=UPI00286F8ACE|nr:pentapeptide repeat-containing protein [Pseudovibrio sp. M1P-2-3]
MKIFTKSILVLLVAYVIALPLYFTLDYMNVVPSDYSIIAHLLGMAGDKIVLGHWVVPTPKGLSGVPLEQTTVFLNLALGVSAIAAILVAIPALALLSYGVSSLFTLVRSSQQKATLDQFSKAAELLGNDSPALRQAGVTILTEVGKKYPKEYQSNVTQLLAAHIREQSKKQKDNVATGREPSRVRGELAASLYKLSELRQKVYNPKEEEQINLGGAYFRGLRSEGFLNAKGDAVSPDLRNAFLKECVFDRADLTGANFQNADVSRARVEEQWRDLFTAEQWATVSVINREGKVIRAPVS